MNTLRKPGCLSVHGRRLAAIIATIYATVGADARFLHHNKDGSGARALGAGNRSVGFLEQAVVSSARDSPVDSALPSDFFSEEMEDTPTESTGKGPLPPPGDPLCDPSCKWQCGSSACDQVCEPVCAPPRCMTLCRKSVQKCETKCGQPRCAVVCPQSDCKDGKCGTCRTVCSPPLCTTECSEECHSHCAKPACNWNCKNPETCPKPKCALKCAGVNKCAMIFRPVNSSSHKVPQFQNKKVVAIGDASLDPNTLMQPHTPPPAWEVTTKPPEPVASTTTSSTTTVSIGMGPVAALKAEWRQEDRRKAMRAQARGDQRRGNGDELILGPSSRPADKR